MTGYLVYQFMVTFALFAFAWHFPGERKLIIGVLVTHIARESWQAGRTIQTNAAARKVEAETRAVEVANGKEKG